MSDDRVPRRDFRVSTRHRGGYDGSLTDVQLQVAETGSIVWARTFSDQQQADEFQSELEADLDGLDDASFRRKYGVPSSA